jgi:hypothetical protein
VNVLGDIITPTPARKVARVDAELRNLEGEAIRNKVIVKGSCTSRFIMFPLWMTSCVN